MSKTKRRSASLKPARSTSCVMAASWSATPAGDRTAPWAGLPLCLNRYLRHSGCLAARSWRPCAFLLSCPSEHEAQEEAQRQRSKKHAVQQTKEHPIASIPSRGMACREQRPGRPAPASRFSKAEATSTALLETSGLKVVLWRGRPVEQPSASRKMPHLACDALPSDSIPYREAGQPSNFFCF